jgi:hypothetical protein
VQLLALLVNLAKAAVQAVHLLLLNLPDGIELGDVVGLQMAQAPQFPLSRLGRLAREPEPLM